jgi:hypothetical protein
MILYLNSFQIIYFDVATVLHCTKRLKSYFCYCAGIVFLCTLTLSNPIFLPPTYSPALIYFGRERGWWITCNYPTVLKEKNRNRKSTTCAVCWLNSVLHEEKRREQENHDVGLRLLHNLCSDAHLLGREMSLGEGESFQSSEGQKFLHLQGLAVQVIVLGLFDPVDLWFTKRVQTSLGCENNWHI